MVWKWFSKGSLVALALMAVTPSYGVEIATYDVGRAGLFVSQTDVNHVGARQRHGHNQNQHQLIGPCRRPVLQPW